MALAPPETVRAALTDQCVVAGLPADLASQLQPLLEALSEANGRSPSCAPTEPATNSQDPSDASGQDPHSQHQRDLELIAQTLALLALADPGYSYPAQGYGYSAPGYSCPPPGCGYPQPTTELATSPIDSQSGAGCDSTRDSADDGGDDQPP